MTTRLKEKIMQMRILWCRFLLENVSGNFRSRCENIRLGLFNLDGVDNWKVSGIERAEHPVGAIFYVRETY
jgi:hypothetical protein